MDSTTPIKEAFLKIKQDILIIYEHMSELNRQIEEIKRTLNTFNPTYTLPQQTDRQINPTIQHIPTSDLPVEGLKPSISSISIGNEGVPTDRQTGSQSNQQTDKNIDFYSFHSEEVKEDSQNLANQQNTNQNPDKISQINRVSQVLESLDSIKKEIRSNFKHLTYQEMAVFSSIYTFEEQGFVVDYSLISQKLSLSESSIRDYTHKLIKKGIPILKSKENNKKVSLTISPELKKIASLQTILALRKL